MIELCKEIALEYFDLEFDLPVIYSDKLGKLVACYSWYNSTDGIIPDNIEVSTKYVLSEEELYGVLKHEVCHWACQIRGLEYRDGDQTFEEELTRIGAPSGCIKERMKRYKIKKNK